MTDFVSTTMAGLSAKARSGHSLDAFSPPPASPGRRSNRRFAPEPLYIGQRRNSMMRARNAPGVSRHGPGRRRAGHRLWLQARQVNPVRRHHEVGPDGWAEGFAGPQIAAPGPGAGARTMAQGGERSLTSSALRSLSTSCWLSHRVWLQHYRQSGCRHKFAMWAFLAPKQIGEVRH